MKNDIEILLSSIRNGMQRNFDSDFYDGCYHESLEKLEIVLNNMKEENARLRALTEWKPIESAPHDTAVLVYGFGYDVAHYNSLIKGWVLCSNHSLINPTHWLPLPVAPQIGEK